MTDPALRVSIGISPKPPWYAVPPGQEVCLYLTGFKPSSDSSSV